MLPLVRRHEFLIVRCILNNIWEEKEIEKELEASIANYKEEQYRHALRFMEEAGVVTKTNNKIDFCCEIEPEFVEYVTDLLEYGLSQYESKYTDEVDFLLYQDYRQDQALLKILENPKHNQYGSYYKNNNMYIFAGLKKDDSIQEHLKYNNKFLDEKTFQWESIANITKKDELRQKECKTVYIFIRKVEHENGITLPFTFVGTGDLQNPRKDATTNGSILYDIHLNTPLPDYLMEDFHWIS